MVFASHIAVTCHHCCFFVRISNHSPHHVALTDTRRRLSWLIQIAVFLSVLLAMPSAKAAPTDNGQASSGNFDGPAELPRRYLKLSLADTPAPGRRRFVKEGQDLQQASTMQSVATPLNFKLERRSGAFTLSQETLRRCSLDCGADQFSRRNSPPGKHHRHPLLCRCRVTSRRGLTFIVHRSAM